MPMSAPCAAPTAAPPFPAVPPLPRWAALRLVSALLADEIGRIRGTAAPPCEWSAWGEATRIDEEDAGAGALGADSLARLECVARVNRFFQLSEVGSEDYLVIRPTLGEWADTIVASWAVRAEKLTFQTSGSTGTPKAVEHDLPALLAEARAHAALLPGVRRVLALTPPHHIYGFLFAILGPMVRGVGSVDARCWGPGRVAAEAREGDLIVATPFLWEMLLRSGARFAPGVVGVTSGAPAPGALWDHVAARGLTRLVEVFGSTETAGVGWRDAPDAPFALFDGLDRFGAGVRDAAGAPLPLQDALDWRGARRFFPAGRCDGAVQVGGVNVFPERVAATLRAAPGVRDCAVRLDGDGAAARLKAFVACDPDDRPAVETALRAACAALAAPERPVRVAFGAALPLGPTGKPADWG